MHILIVDDDETLRTELGSLLRDSGYVVSLASDGSEALERLTLGGVDVVLLDLVMPGMTGLEVLRAAHAAHPTITFIVVTGHGNVEVVVEAMKAGAADFVVKPFEFEALELLLKGLNDKLHARRELARLLESAPPTDPFPPGTDVIAVLLTYMDGTLIGSRTRAGEAVADQDLLAGTLSLIQDFMRTSFPLLRGESLRTIVQGSYRLLIDSGEWTYLILVVRGAEASDLRATMHARRDDFEQQNQGCLVHWNGRAREVVGLDRLLGSFFGSSGGPPVSPASP